MQKQFEHAIFYTFSENACSSLPFFIFQDAFFFFLLLSNEIDKLNRQIKQYERHRNIDGNKLEGSFEKREGNCYLHDTLNLSDSLV